MNANRLLWSHATLKLPHIFILLRLSENKQVLVVDEQKVSVRLALPALSGAFHFPLDFDDILTKDETDLQKSFHHSESNRNIVLMAAGVTDKDGTVAPWFEHSVALFCNLCHGVQIFGQRSHSRKVSVHRFAFGVGDDVGIRRVRRN